MAAYNSFVASWIPYGDIIREGGSIRRVWTCFEGSGIGGGRKRGGRVIDRTRNDNCMFQRSSFVVEIEECGSVLRYVFFDTIYGLYGWYIISVQICGYTGINGHIMFYSIWLLTRNKALEYLCIFTQILWMRKKFDGFWWIANDCILSRGRIIYFDNRLM